MPPANNAFRLIALGLVVALGGAIFASEANGQPSPPQAAADDGSISVNDLYGLAARCNEAILQLAPVRQSPDFPRLKSLQPARSSGKTPEHIAHRLQRMCDLVNRLRIEEGLEPVATSRGELKAAAARHVYLSAGQCLDGLISLLAATDPNQSLGRFYQRTDYQGRTVDEVYGLIDLAVRRLEITLGEPPSQVPVPQTDEQAAEPEIVASAAPASAASYVPGDVPDSPTPATNAAPAAEPVLAMLGQAASASAGTNGQDEAPASTPPAEIKRPKWNFLRYKEDWSGLKDAPESQLTDPWDSIKYVPLSDDGSVWASFGGHMRFRGETWSDFAFGAPADPSDTFALWRGLLHGDVHFGDNIRAFLEVKSALSTDRDLPGGRRTLDVDSLALQQGFIDLIVPFGDDASLTVRPGRQSFLFGKQRLVSPLPWANTLRAWDGVSAIVKAGGWNVHGFWTQFAPVQKYDFNEADAQTKFFGVYATGKIPNTKIKLDAYFLGLDKEDAITFNGTTGPEERYTVGGRTWGQIRETAFDYDLEGALQFGEVGPGDISAFMVATEIGYKPADWWGSPRFKLGFDYASGDETAGGDVETFNHLFPLGHAYFGYMDFVARQNIIDVSPGVSFKPLDKLTVSVAGHLFWRAENADALYNAGGGVVRAGALGSADEIGSELDILLKYKFNRHLMGVFGYSRFFVGEFIEQSGSSNNMDWIFIQLQYTF